MASIHWEGLIRTSADEAWSALRHVDQAHRLFSPVLTACVLDGNVRTVTFANGMVARERIVDVDQTRRRLSYTVLGDMFEHHSASMQILPVDEHSCRFSWTSDFLPNDRAQLVGPLVEQGSRALVANIEAGG